MHGMHVWCVRIELVYLRSGYYVFYLLTARPRATEIYGIHYCVYTGHANTHAFRSRQRARASRRIWLPRPLLFFRLPDPVPWPTPFLPRLPLDCAAASRSSGELPVSAWLGLGLGLGLEFGLGSIGFGFGLG